MNGGRKYKRELKKLQRERRLFKRIRIKRKNKLSKFKQELNSKKYKRRKNRFLIMLKIYNKDQKKDNKTLKLVIKDTNN